MPDSALIKISLYDYNLLIGYAYDEQKETVRDIIDRTAALNPDGKVGNDG